jgi:hypothetical protein
MADRTNTEIVIENCGTIEKNLYEVQKILLDSLSGDSWDRIAAIGMAGKLIGVCREDVVNTKLLVEEESK